MTDPRTVSTTVHGEPCRVTSPLLRQEREPIYVAAADATLTAHARDGREKFFAVLCDCEAQAEHVEAQMALRADLCAIHRRSEIIEADWMETPPFRVVPFRLLGRRWLADWRETADRIEVREGASGGVYMTAVVAGQTVAEKRLPFSCRCDHDAELAKLRAAHPSLWLFDFRPAKGEG